MLSTRKVSQNGRVVIPKDIREAYNIQTGDLVELEVRPVEAGASGSAPEVADAHEGDSA